MNPEFHDVNACRDCGLIGMLDSAGVCPSCAAERLADTEAWYSERESR